MFRFNVLRNCCSLTKKFVAPQQNVITHAKNRLYTASAKYPTGKTIFDHVTTQKPLTQIAKSITPSLVVTRGMSATGDYVRLWQMERLLSVALVPLLPGIFLIDSKLLETLCAGVVVMHMYWGLEALIVDYARPSVVGNVFPKVAYMSLNVVAAVVLAGLLVLIFNSGGIAKSVKKGWAIGKSSN